MDDRERGRRKGPSGAALLEKARQLHAQALQHQYDVPAWEQLAEDLRAVPSLSEDSRAAFEEFLAVMPSASTIWVRYSELEMKDSNFEATKLIFGRCLLNCPTVDMHQQYLKFIKRINEGRGAAGMLELRSAYEFSLDTVGQDLAAGSIWQDYIALLLSPKPGSDAFKALYTSALEGQEEAARTPVIRRVYQRAVVVPSLQVEAIWRAYEAWETKADKQLAKKVLDEWRPRFQAARSTMRDRRRRLENVHLVTLPFPPGKGGFVQGAQYRQWMQYLAFEKSNPQRLEPDSALLLARITLAYGQCLTVLWQHPEVWLDHALTQQEVAPERGLAVLARAQRALPTCSLLKLAQAEVDEALGKLEEAKQVYEAMAAQLEAELPSVNGETADGAEAPSGTPSPYGGEQGALIWVQYMKFLRRTGQVPQARQLFLRARRWQAHSPATQTNAQPPPSPGRGPTVQPQGNNHSSSGWQVYAAMASMEWATDRSNPRIPCKIFELGLEDARLAKDPAYILAYYQFLNEAGDVDNARALFERAFAESENSSSVALWRAYVLFEFEQGDLAASSQVQRRMRSALGYILGEGLNESAAAGAFSGNMQSSLALALCKYGYGGSVPAAAEHARHLRRMAGLDELPAPIPESDEVERSMRERTERERERDWEREREREGSHRREERERDRDRDRERERDRRRSASRSPPPRRGPPPEREGGPPGRPFEREGPPRGGPAPPVRGGPPPREEGAPLLYLGPSGLPEAVEVFVRELPPPMAVEGPPVPVEAVMDIIMYADLSQAALAQAAAELDMGRLPSGAAGVAPPSLMAGPPLMDQGAPAPGGYPPVQGPPIVMQPPAGPPPSYDGGPPGPSRKRRWDGGPEWDQGGGGYSAGGAPPPGEWEQAPGGGYSYDDRRR